MTVTWSWTFFRLLTAAGAATCCFVLGFIAYWKNRSARLNRSFALFNLFLGLWNISDVVIANCPPEWALFFDRLSYIWGTLVVPAFVSVSLECAQKPLKGRWSKLALRIPALFLIAVAFTPWVIGSVQQVPHFEEVPGPLFAVFILFSLGWYGYGVGSVFVAYRRAAGGARRNQLKYWVLGFFMAFIAATSYITSMVAPDAPPVYYVFETAYTVIVFYAVVRFRLMDINLAFRYGAVYSTLGLAIGAPFAFFVRWWSGSLVAGAVSFMGPVVGYFLVSRFRPKMLKVVDLLPPFKGRYDSLKRLEDYRKPLMAVRSVDEWARRLVEAVLDVLSARSVNVLYLDPVEGRYLTKAATDLDGKRMDQDLLEATPTDVFVEALKRQGLLIRDSLAESVPAAALGRARMEMEYVNAEVSVPVFLDDELVAVLNLGEKSGKGMYTDLDVSTLLNLVGVAQNALWTVTKAVDIRLQNAHWAHDIGQTFAPDGDRALLAGILDGRTKTVTPEVVEKLRVIDSDMAFMWRLSRRMNSSSGGKGYEIKPCSLAEAYRRAQCKYEKNFRDRGVRWKADVPPETALVNCDDLFIECQVIMNLVRNAARYTTKGGSIELGYSLAGSSFVGFVKDSGAGIAKEDLPHVFESGYQGSKGAKGSSGLGLAIVKGVVEAHRGKVRVESQPGKGATFFFELPLSVGEEGRNG